MSGNQRTLEESGLPRQMGRMVEDSCRQYPGGLERLELAKGHPDWKQRFYAHLDRMAGERVIATRPSHLTIRVGNFQDVEALRAALGNEALTPRVQARVWAESLMDWRGNVGQKDTFWLVPELGTIDLYRATNTELGQAIGQDYSGGCYVHQSFAALEQVGAVKLPPEAGPQYRLRYLDQPTGEWEFMYMDPIIDSFGPSVFSVVRDDGCLWLCSYRVDPDQVCNGGQVWVFGRK